MILNIKVENSPGNIEYFNYQINYIKFGTSYYKFVSDINGQSYLVKEDNGNIIQINKPMNTYFSSLYRCTFIKNIRKNISAKYMSFNDVDMSLFKEENNTEEKLWGLGFVFTPYNQTDAEIFNTYLQNNEHKLPYNDVNTVEFCTIDGHSDIYYYTENVTITIYNDAMVEMDKNLFL